jgi:hypothetical protein
MKKTLSSIIGLLLILNMVLPFTAFAAASGSASLTGPGTVRAGDTITVNYIVKGTNIEGAQGEIKYDPGQLSLPDPVKNVVQKVGAPWRFEFNDSPGTIKFLAIDENLSKPINSTVTLFAITFKVNSNLAPGSGISITTRNNKISDGSLDTDMRAPSYSKSIAVPLSTNNFLSSMRISDGTLSPSFDKNTTSYSVSVPFTVSKLNVTAAPEDSKSKVSVSSPTLKAGGTTSVVVTVTAENGAKKTYTISVKREQDPNYKPSANNFLSGISVSPGILSPVFKKDVTAYVVWLPYEVDKITVTGNPEDGKASTSVSGGSNLVPGQDNTVEIVCTAENGDKKVYTVIAKRAASLTGDNAPADDSAKFADAIKSAGKDGKARIINMDLSARTAMQVGPSVFTALTENKDAVMDINLGGARILFEGKDVTNQPSGSAYDFTYTPGSQYFDTMIQAAGDEHATFTYSFAYHGDLPGYATFVIYTNFAPGTEINVYKYDPEGKKYITIASKLTVGPGGAVTYRNNSCSDYMITSKTISGAVESPALSQQRTYAPGTKAGNCSTVSFILTGILALMAGFGSGFIVRGVLRKSHRS